MDQNILFKAVHISRHTLHRFCTFPELAAASALLWRSLKSATLQYICASHTNVLDAWLYIFLFIHKSLAVIYT